MEMVFIFIQSLILTIMCLKFLRLLIFVTSSMKVSIMSSLEGKLNLCLFAAIPLNSTYYVGCVKYDKHSSLQLARRKVHLKYDT